MATVSARDALPAYLFRGTMKEELIQYLATADCATDARRRWYRQWCAATMTTWHAADADRVAPRPETIARVARRAQPPFF
jgi:hypothetical protein